MQVGMGFGWLLDRFLVDLGIENPSKIDANSDRKRDAILDASWRALGQIWDGFWLQVGGQVGAKLAPKSEKWGPQDDVNKYAEKSC